MDRFASNFDSGTLYTASKIFLNGLTIFNLIKTLQSGFLSSLNLSCWIQTILPLNIFQNVEAYLFTTSQSQNTINQIGYTLTGPEGDTIINVAYWDAIPFPFIVEANALPTFGDVCIPVILGCMDSTAFNYNPLANVDDGSCIPIIYGCTDPSAFNYDPIANTEDFSCIPIVYGCMDSTSFNYDPNANVDNGSCIPFVYGCMDSTAVNYDPLANVDNGSCITAVPGCTDVSAYNYDPNANVSDSTACLYDAGCVGGPGEPYWLNNPCYAWVIDVDSYCCDTEWDSDCQSLYQYCYDGYPLDISELAGSKIAVYPNPTKDVLNVTTSLNNVKFDLYDLSGRKLRSGENQKRAEVDMRNLPIGIYILQVNYDGNIYNKKIVKED